MTPKKTRFKWEAVADEFSDIISAYRRKSGLRFESEREAFLTTVIDAAVGRFSTRTKIANRFKEMVRSQPEFRAPIEVALLEESGNLYADSTERIAVVEKLKTLGLLSR